MMSTLYNAEDIISRLQRRFPPTAKPELRMALYERLGRLCEDSEIGQQVYHVIASAAADAAGKREPGRYFAHVVMLRLREGQLVGRPEI